MCDHLSQFEPLFIPESSPAFMCLIGLALLGLPDGYSERNLKSAVLRGMERSVLAPPARSGYNLPNWEV